MRIFLNILKRLVYIVILLIMVLVLNFILIHAAPGDPAMVIIGEMGGGNEQILAELRQAYGLDKPLVVQIGKYLGQVAQGNLGYSYYYNQPVLDLILQRIPATLLLALTALTIAVSTGIMLGVLAAKKPDGVFSSIVTVISLLGYSAPVFWTGLMLLILFASWIPLFPISGMYSLSNLGSDNSMILDVAHHLVLPAFTLAIMLMAQFSRMMRVSMIDVLGADYIRTARAKGASERSVFGRHALRNAILPIVTQVGLQMSTVFSGAILVETVFSWPGMGSLAFSSIMRRDYPTLLGILFLSTFMVIIANLFTDCAYKLIDPRIGGKTKE